MNKLFIYRLLIALIALVVTSSCHKDDPIGEDPYAGGKSPLGVFFLNEKPIPETAAPGEVVRFLVKWLKKYEKNFKFLINEMETEIVELSDSTIDVRIPNLASTGGVSVKLQNQVFFGPRFFVGGKVSVDEDFGIKSGFDGSVTDILPFGGGFIVTGDFTDFDNEKAENIYRNGIHYINSLGKTDGGLNFGYGSSDVISSIIRFPSGKFLIAGAMTNFNKRLVLNAARLNANGSLDTLVTPVINPNPENELNDIDTVTAFNGGSLDGAILKLIPTSDEGAIAFGRFSNHIKIDYRYSSRENKRAVYTKVRNIMKFQPNGSLDSTFASKNSGTTGNIAGAAQNELGQIVIVGDFTNFNNQAKGIIVRINSDGSVDQSFNVGSGANNTIFSVKYNSVVKKYVIAGNFTQFNGQAMKGLVVLNADGSIDNGFKMGDLGNGIPIFAQILNNGKIVVSGSFTSYNGIKRSQLLILEPNGDALQSYNNIGDFDGFVNTVVETTSSQGYPAILIGGSFNQVNGKRIRNIVKLEIRN